MCESPSAREPARGRYFIPLTFIAGVYAMNFVLAFNGRRLPLNMPELKTDEMTVSTRMISLRMLTLER